jgi:hypothetical protein
MIFAAMPQGLLQTLAHQSNPNDHNEAVDSEFGVALVCLYDELFVHI